MGLETRVGRTPPCDSAEIPRHQPTAYAPKTVSGIRESIELKDYALAEQEVPKVAKAVSDEAAFVEMIATQLEQLAGSGK